MFLSTDQSRRRGEEAREFCSVSKLPEPRRTSRSGLETDPTGIINKHMDGHIEKFETITNSEEIGSWAARDAVI